jgi:hypothetical protein
MYTFPAYAAACLPGYGDGGLWREPSARVMRSNYEKNKKASSGKVKLDTLWGRNWNFKRL